MSPSRPHPRWVILFSLAVAGGVTLLAVTHPTETRQFWSDLGRLSPGAVALAFLLILAQVTLQALRMWAIVPRDARLRVVRAGYIFAVGDWTNIFVPVRGGDALKVLLLTRGDQGGGPPLSLPRATGAMLADKVSDIGTLVLLCAMTGLLSLLVASARVRIPVGWVLAIVVVVLVLFLATFRRSPWRWLVARAAGLRDLASGLSALKDPARVAASVAFSLAARFAEVLALRVLCGAMGFTPSLPQVLFALVIVNLSVSVPVSFANLGVYEAGLAYGLTRSGMPLPVAITLATTHHMLELVGITASAAGYALLAQLTRRKTPVTSLSD